MTILYIIVAVLALILIVVFTRNLWDKPKDTVDMAKKFETVLKLGYSLGQESKVLETRENFIKVGVKNLNGEKAVMVKQRPGNEFRVIYNVIYDAEYEDFKIEHVYKDDADQNEIVDQFRKEIKDSLVKRA